MKRRTWELNRGDLNLPESDLSLFHSFAEIEARDCIAFFAESGNGAHVWRAWRIARLLPTIPPDLFADLAQYLDAVAAEMIVAGGSADMARALRMSNASGARGEGNAAADDEADDTYLVIRFRHLLRQDERQGRKPNKSAAYRRLANEFKTTEGAMKQRVMRLLGQGQYAARSRRK